MDKFKKLCYPGLFAGVCLGILVVCICGCGKSTVDFISSEELSQGEVGQTEKPEAVQGSENNATEQEPEETLCIYICGQVNYPGVYELPEGSRVCDAFLIAGGLTEAAAEGYWNQARLLSDGEMIYVPTEEEAAERGPQTSSTGDADKEDDKININTATKEELMTLPGIGEAKAEKILAYRKEHGSFSNIEEIMEVEGIKEGMYEKIKDYIVI